MSDHKLSRCLRCGHYHFAGEKVCIYCWYKVVPWQPKPRKLPRHVDVKCHDGKTRRLITQK